MKVLFIVFCLLIGLPSFAAISVFSKEGGKVKFEARGKPALIKIEGNGEGATGTLEKKGTTYSGSFKFQLDSLKTGIGLRDEHMKNKYLEIGKYPEARINFENISLVEGKNSFVAKMLLHGVEQTVQINAEISGLEGKKKIVATFPLKLSAFQIAIPSFQGITVAEEVNVSLELAQSL